MPSSWATVPDGMCLIDITACVGITVPLWGESLVVSPHKGPVKWTRVNPCPMCHPPEPQHLMVSVWLISLLVLRLNYCPFVRGIHQSLVDSPHKEPVMWTRVNPCPMCHPPEPQHLMVSVWLVSLLVGIYHHPSQLLLAYLGIIWQSCQSDWLTSPRLLPEIPESQERTRHSQGNCLCVEQCESTICVEQCELTKERWKYTFDEKHSLDEDTDGFQYHMANYNTVSHTAHQLYMRCYHHEKVSPQILKKSMVCQPLDLSSAVIFLWL